MRFATLAVQSFWIDEAVTVLLVRQPFDRMLSLIPETESTPPAYYVVAWVWTQLFGTGEVGIRSLSALAGTLTIPVAYAAAARLVSPRAGLVVAALAAVNPLLVWFSQEARSYALLVLLTTASLALFARLVEQPARRTLIGWALVSALALATHYFAFFVIAPQVAWLVWRARSRGVVVASAAIAAAGAALLPLLVGQASNDRAEFIRASDLAERALQVPKQYLTGYDAPLEAAAAVVASGLAAVGLWLLARRADARERRGAALAGAIALPALVLPLVLAVVGADYLITRNVIAAWVPAAIVLAAGLGGRRSGRAGVVAAAALCSVSLALVVAVAVDPAYQRSDWRGVAKGLGPLKAPGRAVVVTPFLGKLPLALYTQRIEPLPGRGARVAEVTVVAVAQARQGGTAAPPPARMPPPLQGFLPPEVDRRKTYTLVRYRARDGERPAGIPQIRELRIGDGEPGVGLQVPRR